MSVVVPGERLPRRLTLYLLLAVATIIVPVVLWVIDLPLILYSWGKYYQVFELFGFCAGLALLGIIAVELKSYTGTPIERVLLIVLPFAVIMHYLSFLSDYSARSGDYLCYEAAAKAVLEGGDPYGKCYFYPPLMAQAMAGAFRLGEWGVGLLRRQVEPLYIWYIIFYVYQCIQFYLIALAVPLCHRLACKMGLRATHASVLVAMLFLFNNPLMRTLRHNQVNLWVLDAVLLGLLLLDTRPWLAGLAVALAGHIKLYPLVLLGPWLLARRWRALLGAAIGLVVILFLQTGAGRDWTLWSQYLASPFSDPKVIAFRNASLQSIIFNTFRALRYVIGSDLTQSPLLDLVRAVATLGVGAWFLVRMVQRERALPGLERALVGQSGMAWARIYRDYGHTMDMLALSLIVSPSVWVHQYVLALPVVLWAAVTRGRDRPWMVGIAVLLMFMLPVFDIFPLSYHRVVGLAIVVVLTSPRELARRWAEIGLEGS